MVTKALVEKLLDTKKVKIRIPIFDRCDASSLNVPTDELREACICTLPNCNPNLQPGDVVFVTFEDNNYSNPVIIGHLYRNSMTPTYCDIILNSLEVLLSTKLPDNTTIGKVTSSEISTLKGSNINIDTRFRRIEEALQVLQNDVRNLSNK